MKNIKKWILQILQGSLIGLGAVLPGISGGVLCVIFGIYKPVMELLSKPFKNFKTHVPMLLPVLIGLVIGFLGVSKVLAFLLNKYPDPSVCLFIGLIVGMFPSLFKEAGQKGRNKNSFISMAICFGLVLGLLLGLNYLKVNITPNFFWYLFCGFCAALSIIAPGLSFSTLLMPLGLYTPFIEGIGNFDLNVLIPGGIGGVLTILCLVKGVNYLLDNHYSTTFHGIFGIVIAATIMTIPFASIAKSFGALVINILCFVIGIICAILLDKFNSKYQKEEINA